MTAACSKEWKLKDLGFVTVNNTIASWEGASLPFLLLVCLYNGSQFFQLCHPFHFSSTHLVVCIKLWKQPDFLNMVTFCIIVCVPFFFFFYLCLLLGFILFSQSYHSFILSKNLLHCLLHSVIAFLELSGILGQFKGTGSISITKPWAQ